MAHPVKKMTAEEYRIALENLTQRKLSDKEFTDLLKNPTARLEFEKKARQAQATRQSQASDKQLARSEKLLKTSSKFENLQQRKGSSASHYHTIPTSGEKVPFQLVPAHTSKKFSVPQHI